MAPNQLVTISIMPRFLDVYHTEIYFKVNCFFYFCVTGSIGKIYIEIERKLFSPTILLSRKF